MNDAISGAILFGFWAIGLIFFRFWRRNRDRLFWLFGMAFWLLAVERLLLLATPDESEARPYIYTVRLAAFTCIIVAIYQKNKSSDSHRAS